jgi:membrane dipeptidase
MFITDAHLDLAYNILNKDRDPRRKLVALRAAEAPDYPRGIPTVSFSAMRRGGVGLVFATIFSSPADNPFPDDSEEDEAYSTPVEAHRMGMKQIDAYRRLVDEDESLRLVTDTAGLDDVLAGQDQDTPLIGLTLLMEGADHIRTPDETELWVEAGVRLIGPAWDDTQYCAGAWRGAKTGLTKAGHALLEVMGNLDVILDLTHMNEIGTLQALDVYQGPIVATHSNARALVPGERQLDDNQIRRIGEREGVIGIVLYNAFLMAGWHKGQAKDLVTLDQVVAHIDHICQTIGDAAHVGIGSDLDGGFGAADIPAPLDSIADLPLIAGALAEKGYAPDDIAGIMGANWVNLLRRAWA